MCGGGFSALTSGEVDPQDPEKAATADAVAGSGAFSAQSAAGAAGSADAAAASTGSAYTAAAADDRAVSASDPYTTEYFTDADKAPGVTALVIPASVEHIDLAFFQLFPNAASIEVAPGNAAYSSENGLLLDAAETNLLLVPEGMEGEAVLPSSLATVPACVFSRCTKLSAIDAVPGGTADSAFTSSDGILYTADKATLVAAPAGLGASASIVAECTTIAAGAFWGNAGLKTIVAPGHVGAIAAGENSADSAAAADGPEAAADDAASMPAFNAETVADATVVTTERAAWEAAGFTRFAEPAEAGDTAQVDGFLFTLLADGTVSVGWAGEGDVPADLVIPATGAIDGIEYRVSRIADAGFADQQGLCTVVIPASVATIGKDAFNGCANLADAQLSASVVRIEARAFKGTALDVLVLPESVQYLGEEALGSLSGTVVAATHDVAIVSHDVLAASTGVSVYAPLREDGAYAWGAGLPMAGNHVYPYALDLASEALELSVGDEADLFEGGALEVPEGLRLTLRYNAAPISVSEDGTVSALKLGTASVQASLILEADGAEHALDSAARAVSVGASAPGPSDEPGAEAASEDASEVSEAEPAESFESAAVIQNELGEDTVESFSFTTEADVPMMYSTVRLSSDAVALATYATTKLMTTRYSTTNGRSSVNLESYNFSTSQARIVKDFASADAYYSVTSPALYTIEGGEMRSSSDYYYFTYQYTLSGTNDQVDTVRNRCWSSTTSHVNRIPNGTLLNNYATVYGIFPIVFMNAGSCNGSNGSLIYQNHASGASPVNNGASFTESNPYSYWIKGATIEGRITLSSPLVQSWKARLNGVANVGWSTSKDGEPITGVPLMTVYSFSTLYAVYPEHTVSFDNVPGRPSFSEATGRYGQTMPTVTPPTRAGYIFRGYYDDVNGQGTKYYNADGTGCRDWDVNGDISLYAYWVKEYFTITLDYSSNYGGNATGQDSRFYTKYIYLQYDNSVSHTGPKYYSDAGCTSRINAISAMPLAISGYHVLGYFSSQTGGTRLTSSDGAFVGSSMLNAYWDGKPITEDTTIYAQYAPDVTSVYLNKTANTGYGSTAGTTSYVYVHYQNGKFSSSACTTALTSVKVPTAATGYKFNGYYTAQSGGTRMIDANGNYTSSFTNSYYSSSTSGSATLYAQYSLIVTKVTLDKTTNTGADSNPGGTSTLYVKYNTGKYTTSSCTTALSQIEKPSTATGYAFTGYWTTASGNGVQLINKDGAYTSSFSNVYFESATEATLYARYSRTTYTVTFDANKPSGASNSVTGTMSSQTFTYGTAAALNENKYALKGWTFLGWNTAANGTKDPYSDKQTVTDIGTTTLYAQWSATTHTVSFSPNGGTGGQSADVTATFDSTMPAISTTRPERDGYTFMGWYDNEDYAASGAKQYYTSSCGSSVRYTLESNLTLYAGWRANTDTRYIVRHYQQNIADNNYTLKDTENLTGTTDATASPNAKSYTGFTHVTTANSKESGTIAGDGSLVLSFYYDRTLVPVLFESNGGSEVEAQQVRYGAKADPNKAITTRDGYTFAHWSTNKYTFTPPYNFDSAVTGGLTLYAKWDVNTDTPYKVEHYRQKLDGDYELYTTTNHQGTTDTEATAADKLLALDGFRHVVTDGSVETGIIKGNGSLVLRVYYDQNSYSIRFDGNGNDGGSIPDDISDLKYEQPWSIDAAKVPTRTGYTFRGWQKEDDGSVYLAGNVYVTALTAEDGAVVTLKAKWDNNPYRILLDANGGSPSDVVDAHYDQEWSIRADQVPHRRGYFFVGWSRAGADAVTADYLMPSSGDFTCTDNLSTGDPTTVTLYAVWQAQIYYIQFDGNGAETGSVPDRMAAFYTDQDPNVEIPVYGRASDNDLLARQGMHVVGWSTDPTDTDKATARGDWYEHGEVVRNVGLDGADRVPDDAINQRTVTLYAIWKTNAYTIIFQKNQGDYVTDDGGITQSARIMRDVEWGERYVIRETAVRGGFEFAGWEDESGEVVYDVGDVLENLTDEDGGIVLLFARWQGAPYRVYFDGNGGTGQMWTSSEDGRFTNHEGVEFFYDRDRGLYYTQMYFNVSERLPLCGFMRDGYAFAGWTTGRDDPESASFRNGQLVLDLPAAAGGGNEVTLYAFWEAQLNVSVPCIAVLQVDMDGMTGYHDGLAVVDVTDQFDTDGCASSFVSRTPADTYLSWVTCIPVEEGLRTIFPGADLVRREDGSLVGTSDVSITIADKNDPAVRGAYDIGSDAGYKPTSNPFFKIPANGTLPLSYQLTVNRPEVEMGFREQPVQVAWLKYDISLVEKLTLNPD